MFSGQPVPIDKYHVVTIMPDHRFILYAAGKKIGEFDNYQEALNEGELFLNTVQLLEQGP